LLLGSIVIRRGKGPRIQVVKDLEVLIEPRPDDPQDILWGAGQLSIRSNGTSPELISEELSPNDRLALKMLLPILWHYNLALDRDAFPFAIPLLEAADEFKKLGHEPGDRITFT
jgi:hypothetical protein